MENPFGHHHHHHHHRTDDAGDQPPPPFPPPSFAPPPPRPEFPSYYDQPPPPPFSSFDDQPPLPPPSFPSYEGRPPAYAPPEQVGSVYQSPYSGGEYEKYPTQESSIGYAQHEAHVSHESAASGEERHRHRPHMPAFIESHIHGHGHGHKSEAGSGLNLSSKPSVKVYCKAETNHMLAIRDGKVILARADPNDPTQHWVKDEKYSTQVKDQEGYPCFALVNKATGQAMKHSIGATHPVQLIAYNPDVLDESILWTMGKDLGSGYRQIRMVNNTRLVVDAFNGDKNHGGVHDGTTIVLWQPGKGDNQRWHITPY